MAIIQLIAAQLRLVGHLVGIDVDQLDHPVGIGAAGGGNQMYPRLARDRHRLGQDTGDSKVSTSVRPEKSR